VLVQHRSGEAAPLEQAFPTGLVQDHSITVKLWWGSSKSIYVFCKGNHEQTPLYLPTKWSNSISSIL